MTPQMAHRRRRSNLLSRLNSSFMKPSSGKYVPMSGTCVSNWCRRGVGAACAPSNGSDSFVVSAVAGAGAGAGAKADDSAVLTPPRSPRMPDIVLCTRTGCRSSVVGRRSSGPDAGGGAAAARSGEVCNMAAEQFAAQNFSHLRRARIARMYTMLRRKRLEREY